MKILCNAVHTITSVDERAFTDNRHCSPKWKTGTFPNNIKISQKISYSKERNKKSE